MSLFIIGVGHVDEAKKRREVGRWRSEVVVLVWFFLEWVILKDKKDLFIWAWAEKMSSYRKHRTWIARNESCPILYAIYDNLKLYNGQRQNTCHLLTSTSKRNWVRRILSRTHRKQTSPRNYQTSQCTKGLSHLGISFVSWGKILTERCFRMWPFPL